MVMTAIVVALLGSQAVEGAALTTDPFVQQAEQWLLNGQRLPVDYRVQLLAMPPEQRAQTLVYLRRIGLLVDRPWSVEDILRPASTLQPEGSE